MRTASQAVVGAVFASALLVAAPAFADEPPAPQADAHHPDRNCERCGCRMIHESPKGTAAPPHAQETQSAPSDEPSVFTDNG